VARCPPDLLDDLADVLAAVRTWAGVTEKRPGIFYVRGQPFLHFHLLTGSRRCGDIKGRHHWVRLDLPRPLSASRRRVFLRELRTHYRETVRRLGVALPGVAQLAEPSPSRVVAIIPEPVEIGRGEGEFLVTPATVIVTDTQTREIGKLLAKSLAPGLGLTLRVVEEASLPAPSSISLGIDPTLKGLGDEGYTLGVTATRIRVRAPRPAGAFYGTQTLRQLFPAEAFGTIPAGRELSVPAVTIRDYPRFPWRGVLLDPARHFIPKADLLKLIDVIALHKMNAMNLHLTDHQGWRVEIRKYPKLTMVGGRRRETQTGHLLDKEAPYDGKPHGGFYTQDDIREIVARAKARFVTVVPGIAIPGHARAMLAAYPELSVTGGERLEVSGHFRFDETLINPSPRTIEFLKNVYVEVMELFPGRYIDIGGDEAFKGQWQKSRAVRAQIKKLGLKNEEALQSWLLGKINTFIRSKGRRAVGYDEVVDGGIPPGMTVMSWRGFNGGIIAAREGHDVIMVPAQIAYFDWYQTHDPAEPLALGGYTPLDKVYAFEPVPELLTPAQAKRVIGSQAMLWSEFVPTTALLEYKLFPRALAMAELLWTLKERKNFTDFVGRLGIHEARLTAMGVNFRPVSKLQLEPTFPKRKDPLEALMPGGRHPHEPTLDP
jgi:hexosaminidase